MCKLNQRKNEKFLKLRQFYDIVQNHVLTCYDKADFIFSHFGTWSEISFMSLTRDIDNYLAFISKLVTQLK